MIDQKREDSRNFSEALLKSSSKHPNHIEKPHRKSLWVCACKSLSCRRCRRRLAAVAVVRGLCVGAFVRASRCRGRRCRGRLGAVAAVCGLCAGGFVRASRCRGRRCRRRLVAVAAVRGLCAGAGR